MAHYKPPIYLLVALLAIGVLSIGLWMCLRERGVPQGPESAPSAAKPTISASVSSAPSAASSPVQSDPPVPGTTPQTASPRTQIAGPKKTSSSLGADASNFIDHEIATMHLPQRLYKLSGKVLDVTPYISDEALSRIASVKDPKEMNAEFGKRFGPQPASNAVVVLKGGTVSLQARTDSEGNFEFPRLQSGSYEVSCENPTGLSGEKCMATGKTRIDLGLQPYSNVSDCHIKLEIRADLVTIKGRITDINGRPVADAKVTGKRVKPYNPEVGHGDPTEESLRDLPEFTTVSAADGSYVLRGFEPTNIGATAKYLVRGKSRADVLDFAEVHVEYPPLTLDKAQVERVPLVTEESLAMARRLLPSLLQMVERTGDLTEYKEKEDISLPSSHGTTIALDIVLGQ